MRSLEYLMQLYPHKTATEILEIQAKDKKEDKIKFQEANKKRLEFIEDINKNGGYYKGRFGLDQHYFYKVYDLEINSSGKIYMKVDSIVLFIGCEGGAVSQGNVNLEKRTKEYENLDNYGLEREQRTTVIEWNKINDYIGGMAKFWE